MTNEELAVKAKAGDGEALLDLWKQNAGLIYLKARTKFKTRSILTKSCSEQ